MSRASDPGRAAGLLTAFVGLGFAALDAAARQEPGSSPATAASRVRRAALVAAPFLAGGHVMFWGGLKPRRRVSRV